MEITDFSFPPWADLDRFTRTQLPVLEEICSHYDDGADLVILDLPCGGGKTLLAEMVRQYLQTRALYICTSLVLQDQVKADFPYMQVVKGRRNYVPLDVQTDPENFTDPWGNVPNCADCDKKEGICSYCTDTYSCPYPLARDSAIRSDLGCTNTAYFIAECSGARSRFSGHPFVIADECDLIPNVLAEQVSVSISKGMQRMLRLDPPEKKTKEDAWQRWFDYAIPHIEKNRDRVGGRNELEVNRNQEKVDRLLDRMAKVVGDVSGWIYDGYQANKKEHIEFKPIKVDAIAPDAFWKHGQRWLCMSATVISPEEFVQSLGFPGSYRFVSAPSVFDPARRPIFFYPGARMVGKQEVAKVEAWPQMTTTLHAVLDRYPDENVLVHTHSYGLTQHLFDDLSGNGRPVWAYLNSSDRAETIEQFDKTPGSVLLAPSLDRGFDGAGDRVRCVILTKTPYPYLGDKQVAARLYLPGGKLWWGVQVTRSIAQMVGRGMRSEEDQCDVWIIDSEFARFYDQWKKRGHVESGTSPHLLFPKWFTDALKWESVPRFELRKEIRERQLSNV